MKRESEEHAAVPSPPEVAAFVGAPATTVKALRSGTHRTRSLAETEAFAVEAARLAGVSRLAEMTGLDRTGIPTWSAARPAAEDGNLTVSGGKGLTAQAARLSALMEAVERHCGERQGRAGLVTSRAGIGPGPEAVDPASLILSATHRYGGDHTILEWWPTRDLVSGATILVPAAAILCPYGYEPYLFKWSSNGLASGNCLPEALLHGLLEVIERDATSFCEASGEGTRLDTGSLPPGENRELVKRLGAVGLEVHVRVCSTEVGIPTFHVVLDDVERCDPMLINGGFGCHLDPAVGLSRALSEAALSRATVIAGNREDLEQDAVKRQLGYRGLKGCFADWFRPAGATITLADIPDQSTDSIAGDLGVVVERLRSAGFGRVLAADLSLPGFGVAVARAVVPGLEMAHIDRDRRGRRLGRALARSA